MLHLKVVKAIDGSNYSPSFVFNKCSLIWQQMLDSKSQRYCFTKLFYSLLIHKSFQMIDQQIPCLELPLSFDSLAAMIFSLKQTCYWYFMGEL